MLRPSAPRRMGTANGQEILNARDKLEREFKWQAQAEGWSDSELAKHQAELTERIENQLHRLDSKTPNTSHLPGSEDNLTAWYALGRRSKPYGAHVRAGVGDEDKLEEWTSQGAPVIQLPNMPKVGEGREHNPRYGLRRAVAAVALVAAGVGSFFGGRAGYRNAFEHPQAAGAAYATSPEAPKTSLQVATHPEHGGSVAPTGTIEGYPWENWCRD